MGNYTKTQDSFESCYSCIFENSQDSQVDSFQETLNSKVFLLPCSYNDIWLVNQLNELKLISQSDDELIKLDKYDQICSDGDEKLISNEDSSVTQEETFSDYTSYCNFISNESLSSTKLSDIVKNKLLSNKNATCSNNHNINNNINYNSNKISFQNQNLFSEEDTILIDELVKELSIHSTSSYSNNTNSNTSSNSNLTENVKNCTNYFTQDEIDGIKEILSQEC
ncbi:uncharacterized protein ELE39_002728 [Cryptosporidium sp. chipmunk genotype I]|uniref:uncharacterized protein n=1 Tax=Cryptosporidium sp. chipmunk genotype I TaxID=1280935 RepID=UPI00351A6AF2|nr:hypothetical protein ELE39_002728 [Cryptosporidium sp. chipmunk genotype I]